MISLHIVAAITLSTPMVSATPWSPHTAETHLIGFSGDKAQYRSTIEAHGASQVRCFASSRICIAELPDNQIVEDIERLADTRYVETDRIFAVELPPLTMSLSIPEEAPPSDALGTPECPDQWELSQIRALEAWDLADGADAPVIAIQDSGYLTSHLEIASRISGGYDYGNGDTEPEIEWDSGVPSHGTFIGAMIAGDPDNGLGRSGVAPYASLNLQKIADNSGALYFSYAVHALGDIAEGDLGVRVLNYSIGGSASSDAFRDAVEALGEAGILMITAAGNCSTEACSEADNDTNPFYPGNYTFEHVVTVAGSTRDDSLNSYSHYGLNSVDLAAPGVDLCSAGAYGDDDFYTSGGTSYATPLVSGTAALMLEAHPDLTTTELARVLRASAVEQPDLEEKVRSGGRLDTLNALTTAVPRLVQPPDISVNGTATFTVSFSNPGAAGEAWLVVEHNQAVSLDTPLSGWSITNLTEDEEAYLPSIGEFEVSSGGLSIAHGPVSIHSDTELQLTARGLMITETLGSIRLEFTSEGADYLNAPYDSGAYDSTGFLALPFTIDVDEIYTLGDTGDTNSDTGDTEETGGAPPGGGCSCATGETDRGTAYGLIMLLLALFTRRARASPVRGAAIPKCGAGLSQLEESKLIL